MKKISIILLFLWCKAITGQSEGVSEVRNAMNNKYPTVSHEGKIIFIASELNGKKYAPEELKELEKTATVYQFAKLKGGLKGIICLLLVKDASREVELNKLGIEKVMKLQEKDLSSIDLKTAMFVSSDGQVTPYLPNNINIFSMVNSLITR
jgi:hypothetical protein